MLPKSKRKALLSPLVNGSFLEKMKADNRARFGMNNNWEEHVALRVIQRVYQKFHTQSTVTKRLICQVI